MEISEILESKRKELLRAGNPFKVKFDLEEINVLADVNELRKLKIMVPFPANFERSPDLFACTKKIIDGERTYRVLEFCVLKNRVLEAQVKQVFKKLV